jgi:hypothetical protein
MNWRPAQTSLTRFLGDHQGGLLSGTLVAVASVTPSAIECPLRTVHLLPVRRTLSSLTENHV